MSINIEITTFLEHLNSEERDLITGFKRPVEIQSYLDSIPYGREDVNRCPVCVMRDRIAHCLDGGLFAAVALRLMGFEPIVVDLIPEPGTDDDHVLAIFQQNGGWGALAKSNFVGLRFREPVYHNLRELAMSYFDFYHNLYGQKTLRGYTIPYNLQRMDKYNWMWDDRGADAIEHLFPTLPRKQLVTPQQVAVFSEADQRMINGNMMGINPAGLFQPIVR